MLWRWGPPTESLFRSQCADHLVFSPRVRPTQRLSKRCPYSMAYGRCSTAKAARACYLFDKGLHGGLGDEQRRHRGFSIRTKYLKAVQLANVFVPFRCISIRSSADRTNASKSFEEKLYEKMTTLNSVPNRARLNSYRAFAMLQGY